MRGRDRAAALRVGTARFSGSAPECAGCAARGADRSARRSRRGQQALYQAAMGRWPAGRPADAGSRCAVSGCCDRHRPGHCCTAAKSDQFPLPHIRSLGSGHGILQVQFSSLEGRWGAFRQKFLTTGRCPDRVVCHEHRRSKRWCATVREMKEGPSRPAVRGRPQTTASRCRQKRWW